ncbi:MAG: prepilin-type N-terminal cleavage/methylation domain-containing protein [Planctomycetes bacterium]|nr:prepilin-type N-terminal cleavage/methylation domain-containing protein [Planctomycetota bacterium]
MAARGPRADGFTLIEVLLAIAISATVMMTVGTTFRVLLDAREVVDELGESTEAGPRILNLIERDLRGLWTFNVGKNAVFRGRDMDVGSFEADRLDFLTTTDAVGYVIDTHSKPEKPSLCEVGYWFKQNPRYRDLMELWRREDPMVDSDLLTQGSFQLVHDRLRSFKVTYFKTLGNEAEEFLEWDSSTDDMLPRRIRIEFVLERRRGSSNTSSDAEVDDFEDAEKKYVRHFVLDPDMTLALRANEALLPLLPVEPAEESAGPAGPAGGPAGLGGPAAMGGPGMNAPRAIQSAGEGGKPGGRGGSVTEIQGMGRRGGERPVGGRGNQPGAGRGGQVPSGLPPGFNLGELLRGGGAGGAGGGLFPGGGGRR